MSRSNQKPDCATAEGATSIVPPGTPDWITAELIEQTIRVWQPYYDDVLSIAEAIILIQNVGRMFAALASRHEEA